MPKPRKGESRGDYMKRCKAAGHSQESCERYWNNEKPKSHHSPVLDYINEKPWAILPETLDLIHTIIGRRVIEGKLSEQEIEAALEGHERRPDDPYQVGSTAVIPIYGTITKKMNLFTRLSGGASTELIQKNIQEALDNPDINTILLDIESPGGSVDGPFELSDFIYQSREKKKIVAFANGLMASAAYLIGSAADEIFGTQAAQIGSIGVITAHYDYSKRYEEFGVKKTYLYSGKYKAVGNDAAPLSKEDKNYIQAHLDQLYTMFVDTVARNRGVTSAVVLNDMADGRVFIGSQAQEIGMIEGIRTFDSLLNKKTEGGGWTSIGIETQDTLIGNDSREKEVTEDMDPKVITISSLAELKEKDPAGYKTLFDEASQQLEKTYEDTIEAINAKYDAIIGEQSGRIAELEKRDIIRQEKMTKTLAISTAQEILNESDIPLHLHSKVIGMVPYTKFVKEGELDEEAYRTALNAEIEDWYNKGIKQNVLGTGLTFKEPEGDQETLETKAEDDKWVAHMIGLAGQKLPEGYGTA